MIEGAGHVTTLAMFTWTPFVSFSHNEIIPIDESERSVYMNAK